MAEQTLPLNGLRARGVARSSVISLWEMGFAVVGLFLCLDAGIRTVRILSGTEGPLQNTTIQADYSEGSALTQVLLFSIYLVSVMLMTIHPPRQLMRAFRPALLWLLPLLAMLSVLWSDAPTISFRRAAALLGSSIFGLYLATRYPLRTLLRLLLAVSIIAISLSFLVAFALPAYAIDTVGDWQGVFGQKNQLGQFMALSAIVWLLYVVSVKRHRFLIGFGVLSVVLVVLSRSATAIVLLVTLVAVMILIRLWRLHYSIALPILMVVTIAGGYLLVGVASNPGGATHLLGKDPGLTGRTQLWGLVWQMIRARSWFGYGYGGFWLGFQGPSAPVWRATGWNPPSAHNGFLDLLLDLGIVGLLIFVPVIVVALRNAFALARRGRMMDSAFPLLFLIFFLISNITESFLVAYNTLSWVLFVALTIQLHLWWQEEHRPHVRANAHAPVGPDPNILTPRPGQVAVEKERRAFQEGYFMGAQVTVSAIMPTYNAMPYLKEAIDSVLAQTFTDWELIIVDDGSTDETPTMLAQYTDPRIRVFELGENQGRGKARNVALGFACGKYIAPCDADDISLPERFAKEVAYLESHSETHVVSTQMKDFYADEPPQLMFRYPEDPSSIDRRFTKGKMGAPFGAAMIRSWCFDRFGPFNEDLRASEDFEWFLRVRRSCNFRVLPEALYLYRHNVKNVTLIEWLANARRARYAAYRAKMFGTASHSTPLSFTQFSRRWGTRFALHTADVLRYVMYRLGAKRGGRALT